MSKIGAHVLELQQQDPELFEVIELHEIPETTEPAESPKLETTEKGKHHEHRHLRPGRIGQRQDHKPAPF
jgi:hypothetical protein